MNNFGLRGDLGFTLFAIRQNGDRLRVLMTHMTDTKEYDMPASEADELYEWLTEWRELQRTNQVQYARVTWDTVDQYGWKSEEDERDACDFPDFASAQTDLVRAGYTMIGEFKRHPARTESGEHACPECGKSMQIGMQGPGDVVEMKWICNHCESNSSEENQDDEIN